MAELHSLKPFQKSRKKPKRVGRGLGSSHGTYSTRGMKGQRARSGGSSGLKVLGMKPLMHQTPKNRGFKSIHSKPVVVNVSVLEKNYATGDTVSPETLIKKGILNETKIKRGSIKILGEGTCTKKFTIDGCALSATAREKIEKAGGTIK